MRQIIVMNRNDAIKFSYKIPQMHEKFAIISISEIEDKPPSFCTSENLLSVLTLQFDDVDRDESEYLCMRESDAEKIKQFISYFSEKIDVLIVHCLAGRSRSVGVASAISKWYFNDDSEFFSHYNPNMHVYRLTLEKLLEEGTT